MPQVPSSICGISCPRHPAPYTIGSLYSFSYHETDNTVFGSSPTAPLNKYSFLTTVKDLPVESRPPLELNKVMLANNGGSEVRSR